MGDQDISGAAGSHPSASERQVQIELQFAGAGGGGGAFLYKGRIEDMAVAYAFGFLGYFMKKHDWPRVVFVTALVPGGMLEINFHIALRLIELDRVQFWACGSFSLAAA